MPKLRDDLLKQLSATEQDLMKTFRKRPYMAYTIDELLPKGSPLDKVLLKFHLDDLISKNLIMAIKDEGVARFAKAVGKS